ncbi:MAG: hypothetical protein AAF726_24990 [Planctomycetota bacterium]
MRTFLCRSLLILALPAVAAAQVRVYQGSAPNASTTLDFDSPFVPSGLIDDTDPAFTSAGIASISAVGSWTPFTDTISAGANDMGQSLNVLAGDRLTIAGVGDDIGRPSPGDGIEITLQSPTDEFGLTFVDQIGFNFIVELFDGPTSLGVEYAGYGGDFPRDGMYFRGPSPFDRVLLTFPELTGGVAFDNLQYGEGPGPGDPPLPPECVSTDFFGPIGGDDGGAVYFDVTAAVPLALSSLETHFRAAAGTPVQLEVWTKDGTATGFETSPLEWTLVASSSGVTLSAGEFAATAVVLDSPVVFPVGTTGIALVAVGSSHGFARGFGPNQDEFSANRAFMAKFGSATNAPFSGFIFTPRVWNGTLRLEPASVGSNYCAANPNSTGLASTMDASGTASLASNDLTLESTNLPPTAFAFYIVSRMQGFAPGAGGSAGNLCVAGAIGRYVGPGQLQQADARGSISLAIDLTSVPQPNGPVAAIAGEQWNFQAWHRDSVGGAPTSNFTDGLAITLLP